MSHPPLQKQCKKQRRFAAGSENEGEKETGTAANSKNSCSCHSTKYNPTETASLIYIIVQTECSKLTESIQQLSADLFGADEVVGKYCKKKLRK